jgi:uncharacterized protein (TIGR02246 family)
MDDERAIEDLVRGLIDAWNNGDAEGFARMFVPSAEYITARGQCVRGRDSISELVRQASEGSPVSLVAGPSIECDAAAGTVRFGWAVTDHGVVVRRGSIACTLVRQGAVWLVNSLHNRDATM